MFSFRVIDTGLRILQFNKRRPLFLSLLVEVLSVINYLLQLTQLDLQSKVIKAVDDH